MIRSFSVIVGLVLIFSISCRQRPRGSSVKQGVGGGGESFAACKLKDKEKNFETRIRREQLGYQMLDAKGTCSAACLRARGMAIADVAKMETADLYVAQGIAESLGGDNLKVNAEKEALRINDLFEGRADLDGKAIGPEVRARSYGETLASEGLTITNVEALSQFASPEGMGSADAMKLYEMANSVMNAAGLNIGRPEGIYLRDAVAMEVTAGALERAAMAADIIATSAEAPTNELQLASRSLEAVKDIANRDLRSVNDAKAAAILNKINPNMFNPEALKSDVKLRDQVKAVATEARETTRRAIEKAAIKR